MHTTMFYSAISAIIGYFAGWYVNDMGSGKIVACIIAFIFGAVLKSAREYHANVLALEYEYKEKELKAKDSAVAKAKIQIEKEYKKEIKLLAFTSEDFDESAKALLSTMLKESKKKNVKVSGQSLVSGILKSIK